MRESQKLSLRTCMVSIIAIIVLVILSTLVSCGSPRNVTIKKVVNEVYMITTENDTIQANRRILYDLKEDESYKLVMKDARCVNVKKKL